MRPLTEAMEAALIRLAHIHPQAGSYGRNMLYQPDCDPASAHGLERRGLASIDPPSNSRFGYNGGTIRLTDEGLARGRELHAARVEAERRRRASLELSPPRRGHLRVVRDDE